MEKGVKRGREMRVWRGREMQGENHAEKLPAVSLRDGCCSETALILMQAGNAVTAR